MRFESSQVLFVLSAGWLASACAEGRWVDRHGGPHLHGAAGSVAEHDTQHDAAIDAGVDSGYAPRPDSYWQGIARELATSPSGNVVAISCHNCYQMDLTTSAENLEGTLTKLHAAQQAGADLLEVDVKDEAGVWYVNHNDDGSSDGAVFEDVLADDALLQGNQLLYIEIKEDDPADPTRLLALLSSIASAGYAIAGRDVVIRAFNQRIEQIRAVHQLLVANQLSESTPYFRVQVLYTLAEVADLPAIEAVIDATAREGIDGVEFNYASEHILELLASSRSKGLGTNVFTFGVDDGTSLCAQFRDVTDAITTDSALDLCRAAVENP